MADRISTLPDEILCHILSFLQTKHSVATSILSKRWNHLWPSVLTLCFDESHKTVKDPIISLNFENFVSSVLLQRDAAISIKSFHLNFSYCYDLPCPIINITKWVNLAVQRKVEYLSLHLYTWARFPNLPVTIFTCKTLVVLKLFHFTVMKEGFSDSSVVLPSLKTLHLEYIWFPKLQDFTMFLSRCPVLQDLLISRMFFDHDESRNCNGWKDKDFYLSNLIRANLNCAQDYFLLKAVHSTYSLRLIIDQVHYPNGLIASFHNLTQLKLVSLKHSCNFLVKFLNQCPKLQKLDLHQVGMGESWTRKDDTENLVDQDAVPQCLSLNLTTCNLFNLGQQDELIVAQYILKSAIILQTMKIWSRGHSKNERRISSYPRASSTCKLQFFITIDQCRKQLLKSSLSFI